MSEKVQFTSIEGKGRAVVASSSIKEGDILLSESPLISSQFTWNKEYSYLCCDHCLLPLETAQDNARRLASDKNIILPLSITELADDVLNCNNCGASYCSSKCAETAQSQYHNFECNQYKVGGRFHELIELWKKIHYPPESASINLVIRIFGMIKNNSNCLEIFELLDAFHQHTVNEDLQICHKMLGEKFSAQLSELHNAIQQLFGGDEQLAKYITYDGFVALLAILGTNAQGIGTSSFAHWVQTVSELDISEEKRVEIDEFIDAIYSRFNDTVGEFLDNEGSGLNFILNVVALRDIQPGEEICISYIDECMLSRSRHSRQKYLKENYLFHCNCEKCVKQAEDPDVTSDEEDAMETDEE